MHKRIFFVIMFVSTGTICLFMIIGFFVYRTYTNPVLKFNVVSKGDKLVKIDNEIGYVPTKNGSTIRTLLSSGLSFHVFTDNRGARVNSKAEITPDRVDILTIGGSFAWGHGLENEDTFIQKIRRDLGVTVANFSMGGYGTLQSLQVLRRNVDLKPKVIIYGFVNDHLRRNLSPCAPSYFPLCDPVSYIDFKEDNTPFIHLPKMKYFLPKVSEKYKNDFFVKNDLSLFYKVLWRMGVDFFHIAHWSELRKPDNPKNREASMSYLIKEMSDTAKEINAKLLIVKIDVRKEAPGPPPPGVSKYLDDDVIFVDLRPVIAEHYKNKSEPLMFAIDYHPNKLANELIAREIEKVLKNIL